MLIHIVEDTEAIAVWLGDALELHDPGVSTRVTTSDFITLLDPEPWEDVDVALIDVMMPEISGLDIVRYLTNEHPKVKTIVMTASLPSADEATGLADAVIVKPFDIGTLIASIDTLVSR